MERTTAFGDIAKRFAAAAAAAAVGVVVVVVLLLLQYAIPGMPWPWQSELAFFDRLHRARTYTNSTKQCCCGSKPHKGS